MENSLTQQEIERRIILSINEFNEEKKHVFNKYRDGKIKDIIHFNLILKTIKENIAKRYSNHEIKYKPNSIIFNNNE